MRDKLLEKIKIIIIGRSEFMSDSMRVFYVTLHGKPRKHIFENEIQKKWLLDAAIFSQEDAGAQILSYCVLDNEAHLLIRTDEEWGGISFLRGIRKVWEEILAKEKLFCRDTMKYIRNSRGAAKCSQKIHLLPVTSGITCEPEDYWWCSYPDYLGREWIVPVHKALILETLHPDRKMALHMFKTAHRSSLGKIIT